jgi:hypothetical protein
MTWVLFVIVYSATAAQPVGVTSVPGSTFKDCQTAREEVPETSRSKPTALEAQQNKPLRIAAR